MSARLLIVNADDFGRSPGVNEGVIRAHENGIVTSASLMVNWPAAEQASEYGRRGSLGVGLHLDLGEWAYRDGEWYARYEVVAPQAADSVRAEISRQLDMFQRLMGRPPTHLDSHQHVHREEPIRTAFIEAGRRLRVPVRGMTEGIAYSGAFYGQDGKGTPLPERISVKALIAEIEALEAGVTELACHPAAEVDHESTYESERLREVETLCDARVRSALARCDVALGSFAEVTV